MADEDNFLKETEDKLTSIDKTPDEITFIGIPPNIKCSWKQFTQLADFEYDSQINCSDEVINLKLVIIFNDCSWLERQANTDGYGWGFERWIYHKMPTVHTYNCEQLLRSFIRKEVH